MNPTAQGVDSALIYIFGVSLLMLLGITLTTIVFVIRYRRSKNPEPTSQCHGNLWLETLWTLLPTLIVLSMFYYGWMSYLGLRNVPEDAMEVEATGRMWSWQFKYENGRLSDKLQVPVDRPVKVLLGSADVLHSFFVPAFRIKRDTVPGLQSYVWFQAPETGSFDIFCAEYCGTGHADMISTVEVLPQEQFEQWYRQSASDEASAASARELLQRHGCLGCHSLDGSAGIGPSLQGLAGQQRELLSDGIERTLTIDAAYLRRAIRQPGQELVEGFPPIMPASGDELSEAALQSIIDFLLNETAVPEPDGERLLQERGCLGCHSRDGSPLVGPSFQGIGGRKTSILRDGRELQIEVDADYLRRAIRQPQVELVKDYPPIMPAEEGLSEAEVEAMVEALLDEDDASEESETEEKH